MAEAGSEERMMNVRQQSLDVEYTLDYLLFFMKNRRYTEKNNQKRWKSL